MFKDVTSVLTRRQVGLRRPTARLSSRDFPVKFQPQPHSNCSRPLSATIGHYPGARNAAGSSKLRAARPCATDMRSRVSLNRRWWLSRFVKQGPP